MMITTRPKDKQPKNFPWKFTEVEWKGRNRMEAIFRDTDSKAFVIWTQDFSKNKILAGKKFIKQQK